MNKTVAAVLDGLIVAAMFAIALWTIRQLPRGAQVAIHWGPDGRPDACVQEWAGLLIIPLVACVVWFLVSAYPQGLSAPGKPAPPAGLRRAMLSRVLAIQLAAQAVVAIHALGRAIDTTHYIAIALGLLYVATGAGFRALQPDGVGIGGALHDEALREKIRTVGRWLFGLGGLAIFTAAFGLQRDDAILAVFLLTLGAPLLTMLYAWVMARRAGR